MSDFEKIRKLNEHDLSFVKLQTEYFESAAWEELMKHYELKPEDKKMETTTTDVSKVEKPT